MNQSDSRLLDVDGSQVAYEKCAAGRDYPLYYPTTSNVHGRVLEAYFRKALSLGFDGVYHDDSGFNYYYPYSFDQWDRVSGYLDPVTLRPKALMGHVTLLSHDGSHGGPANRVRRRLQQQRLCSAAAPRPSAS